MFRFALLLLMSLAVSSQAVAKKTTFSDKAGVGQAYGEGYVLPITRSAMAGMMLCKHSYHI